LHFEVHVAGAPTNPFPAVSDACTDELETTAAVGPFSLLRSFR